LTQKPFSERLADAIDRTGAPCCVGLDPRLDWLPREYADRLRVRPTAAAAAAVVTEFHRRVLERLAPVVPAVKPQLAFFEQLGSAGVRAYEDLVECARALGLLVVADAKRADIGPTADAYARAFLGGVVCQGIDISPPAADALTVQPYFGTDGVQPFLDACAREGAGRYILVRTSNPSSSELQSLRCGEGTVAETVARAVHRWGLSLGRQDHYSPVGAVVGATHAGELARLRELMPRTPFLLPGYGAQGGKADDVVDAFDRQGQGGLVVAARSVNFAFRSAAGEEASDWLGAVEAAARAMAADVNGALARAGKGSRR
jgi:orotidine-5'-phosphate decarboxylase